MEHTILLITNRSCCHEMVLSIFFRVGRTQERYLVGPSLDVCSLISNRRGLSGGTFVLTEMYICKLRQKGEKPKTSPLTYSHLETT